VVLYGLGGMGKSQLALQYAYVHKEEYTSIWWISVPTISRGFVSIAQELFRYHARSMAKRCQPDYHRIAAALGLPPNVVTETGLVRASEDAIMEVVTAVKGWLTAEDNQRWLIILDNHDDLKVDIMDYLPPSLSGSVIITSRVSDSARLGDSLEVVGVQEDDAIEILRKSARIDLASFETGKSCNMAG
jgi:hypothetical protein